jgi:hypothetical protein
MANIADGNVTITVRGEDLIARFDAALKETKAFDYDWKTIDRIVEDDGAVSYDIGFCGRWNCDAAWGFLEDFCDDSTKEKFEFDGTEFEEGCRIRNRVYRNAESDWELETDDIWSDEDDGGEEEDEDD